MTVKKISTKKIVCDPDYFMQCLREQQIAKGTKGALHRMLGIPESYNLGSPKAMKLLYLIKTTELGKKVKNPMDKGKEYYWVTPLLKKRVVLAYTMIKKSQNR
jgi:hypothetical protein